LAETHALTLTGTGAQGQSNVKEGPNCVTISLGDKGTFTRVSGNLTWTPDAAGTTIRFLAIIPSTNQILADQTGSNGKLSLSVPSIDLQNAAQVTFIAEPSQGAVARLALSLAFSAAAQGDTMKSGEATCSL
jgi:hypothetical protein